MKRPLLSLLLLTLPVTMALTGCQTTGQQTLQQERSDKINAALDRAADEASSKGETKESLAFLESRYKRESKNPEAATKYAAALREAGRLNRADLILAPFATDEKAPANSAVQTEYASIQAAMGSYPEAEAHARKAVEADPASGQAYHILGIVLDAQGYHPQAEVAFRKALDNWSGDPSPVMNNLGLNLASQGFLDEAIDTLRKAAAIAPNRTEIERNLRIVSALPVQLPRSGTRLVPKVPKPAAKPGNAP